MTDETKIIYRGVATWEDPRGYVEVEVKTDAKGNRIWSDREIGKDIPKH